MSEDVTAGAWTEAKQKAIPVGRDRMQSLVLVWIALPVLGYLVGYSVWHLVAVIGELMPRMGRDFLMRAIPIGAFFAIVTWRLRAATPLAAFCGGMICFLLMGFVGWTEGTSIFHTGLTPLILLFVLTFEATRAGRDRKAAAGIAESRKGRNAAQVIANLGIAALFSSFWGYWLIDRLGRLGSYAGSHPEEWMALFCLPMLAALAEATADTVSSEIGQAFGGTPVMLTTLRRVAPGTDGAVTVLGTAAGVAGAAVIAATGMPALGMSWAECGVAFGAGVAGLFFDSLLGATVERKGWMGNDLVNFASTAFSAGVALVAIRLGGDGLVR